MSDSLPPTVPATRGAMKWVAIGVATLLLAGGSAGGFFWWRARVAAEPVAAGAHEEATLSAAGVVTLEPFIVNLADTDGSRFLRVQLRLLVAGHREAKEIQENEVTVLRLRSAILELLSVQMADRLVSQDGKAALKKTIADRASSLTGVKVIDVLFSEFVVQF
jgi:flagellar basal body-associated protein FliL